MFGIHSFEAVYTVITYQKVLSFTTHDTGRM